MTRSLIIIAVLLVGCAAMRATPQQAVVMDAFEGCRQELRIQLARLTYVAPDGQRIEYWTHVVDKHAALGACIRQRLAAADASDRSIKYPVQSATPERRVVDSPAARRAPAERLVATMPLQLMTSQAVVIASRYVQGTPSERAAALWRLAGDLDPESLRATVLEMLVRRSPSRN